MKKAELVNSLNVDSTENRDSSQFLSVLEGFIKEYPNIINNDNALDLEFKNLLNSAKEVHLEFIPYSGITTIIFKYGSDGMDAFVASLRKYITEYVKKLPDNEDIPNEYLIVAKSIEHINLATTQMTILYKEQEKKINAASGNLSEIEKDIKRTDEIANGLEDKVNAQDEKYSKLTVDFVTILGIFTSITFATFGGLQLLGNVFGRVSDLSNKSNVGSEMMLGAVFLFGTYLILVSLLTGVSKLTGRDYETSFPTRYIMIFSFSLIFLIGIFYANLNWLNTIEKHPLLFSFCLAIAIFLPLLIDYCYRVLKEKKKK